MVLNPLKCIFLQEYSVLRRRDDSRFIYSMPGIAAEGLWPSTRPKDGDRPSVISRLAGGIDSIGRFGLHVLGAPFLIFPLIVGPVIWFTWAERC